MNKRMHLVGLVALTLVDGAACARPKGGLPDYRFGAVCGEPEVRPERLAVCSWVAATDAVVVGTVTSLSFDADIIVSDTNEAVDVCDERDDQRLLPYLRIGLSVEQQLHGRVPDAIDVVVAGELTGAWTPRPAQVDGQLQWLGRDTDEQLVVGQRLGLMLYEAENGVYSTFNEPMFLERNGGLDFSEINGSCDLEIPQPQLDSLDAFETEIAACSHTDASLARAARLRATPLSACCAARCAKRHPAESE